MNNFQYIGLLFMTVFNTALIGIKLTDAEVIEAFKGTLIVFLGLFLLSVSYYLIDHFEIKKKDDKKSKEVKRDEK